MRTLRVERVRQRSRLRALVRIYPSRVITRINKRHGDASVERQEERVRMVKRGGGSGDFLREQVIDRSGIEAELASRRSWAPRT